MSKPKRPKNFVVEVYRNNAYRKIGQYRTTDAAIYVLSASQIHQGNPTRVRDLRDGSVYAKRDRDGKVTFAHSN